MLKGLTVSAVVVALLSSTAGAFSDIQMQSFNLILGNGVNLIGDGAAANTNLLTIGESQTAIDNVRHTTAYQGVNGALLQSAGTVGSNGLFGALQFGAASGDQYQIPAGGVQDQDLSSELCQEVFKVGGNGSVLAMQTLVGIETQLIFTPYGATANVQAVGDTLYNAVGGGPGSTTTIGGGGTISLGQSQTP